MLGRNIISVNFRNIAQELVSGKYIAVTAFTQTSSVKKL